MNLTRTLLSCVICFTLLPVTLNAYKLVNNLDFKYEQANDEICLMQLRETLLLAYEIEVNSQSINFIYQNKNYSLDLVNNSLVLSPGYQLYLYNVDELQFRIENECIYVLYERGKNKFKKIISTKKGIYFDEFSHCPIESNNDCDVQS